MTEYNGISSGGSYSQLGNVWTFNCQNGPVPSGAEENCFCPSCKWGKKGQCQGIKRPVNSIYKTKVNGKYKNFDQRINTYYEQTLTNPAGSWGPRAYVDLPSYSCPQRCSAGLSNNVYNTLKSSWKSKGRYQPG
jgi:hypothetical protein